MKKVSIGSFFIVLIVLFASCVTIPADEIDAFIYRIITNIWERGDRGITADILFDSEDSMEGLIHVWLNGPGIEEDSFDALEEDTDENLLHVLSTCPLPLNYEFVINDIYTFRFEYEDGSEKVRNTTIENTEQNYVNTVQPLPYVTYPAPVDIVVTWDLSNDSVLREIEDEFYGLWVEDIDIGFVDEFEIPDPVEGVYTVTIPSTIFEVNKQYSINIARETRYVGNSHYHKQLVASRAIRFGEWQDFELLMQLQRRPDQERNPRFSLYVNCYFSDFIQPDECGRVMISGPGITGGTWQLREIYDNYWWDVLSEANENLEENHVFQTGDTYTVDIYGIDNTPFRSRNSFNRDSIIGTDNLSLGVIPGALEIQNDWRRVDELNPYIFEALQDIDLDWNYEGDDTNDFIVRLFKLTDETWERVTSIHIPHNQNEHTFLEQHFSVGEKYFIDIYKYFGDSETLYSAVPLDRCYFNFQTVGSGNTYFNRFLYRFEAY